MRRLLLSALAATISTLAVASEPTAKDFPGFYSIERFDGEVTPTIQVERIGKAIDEFPSLRERYIKKTQQFETELPKYIATFKAEFPDYVPTYEIYVLHSLGEMDGGTHGGMR